MTILTAECPIVFSFVIPTLGRTKELRACLETLASDPIYDFEVIVVDQNGDDRLAETVRVFSGMFPLRHLRVKYRNASRARNDGASLASSEWIGFPDDDSQFLPDTLPELRAAVLTPGIDLVSGRMVDERGSASVLAWPEKAQAIDTRTIFRNLTEASFVVRSSLFQLAGGFDPLFGPGGEYPAAEGVDLILRMMRRASRTLDLRFCPLVRMRHEQKVPPFDAPAVVRCGAYGRGAGALAGRHTTTVLLHGLVFPLLRASAGIVIFNGYHRASKIAWLKGFLGGLFSYWRASLSLREPWPNCEKVVNARS